jgi:hypothetical protein
MQLNEPEKQILNDYEHSVTNKIAKYGDRPDFPKLENYGFSRQDLDGYLFDKQAILDMEGSKRTQWTVGGILTVVPVLVLSAFPDNSVLYAHGKMVASVVALASGLLFYLLFVKSVARMIIHYRLGKLKDTQKEAYIKAVLFYEPAD